MTIIVATAIPTNGDNPSMKNTSPTIRIMSRFSKFNKIKTNHN
jgi:hypothetical protein